jgi:DnaJ-class molecular chaperone
MAKGFMDGYKKYDTSDGYGNSWEWKKCFYQRMSKEVADDILGSDDPYTILGLKRSATLAEIKAAFKKLAKMWHPDLNPQRVAEATIKMQKINAAYSLLIM